MPEEKDKTAEVVQDAQSAQVEEPKQEKPKEEPKKEEAKAVPSKFKKLVEEIEGLPLADVAELVKSLEDRWGVAAMAMPVAGAAPASAEAAAGKEEKSSYTLILADAGTQKIAVIKAVREIRQDLGLKEAKDLVDGAPKEVLKDAKKEDAQAAKTKLEAAGAKVELK